MALPEFIATILSTPLEWGSLTVGAIIALLVAYFTETQKGAILGVVIFLAFAIPVLPMPILMEWHYWPAAPAALLLFGLWRWGPEKPPLTGRFK